MTCPDAVTALLAFHANGTLDESSRRRVEEHLEGCADCRELLGLARMARDQMAARTIDPADHVQAQLLAEYAEAPESLEEQTRAWVGSHLQGCDVCASVVPVLRGEAGAARQDSRSRRAGSPAPGVEPPRWWRVLTGTLLHPALSMACLALVVAGLVWLARSPQAPPAEGETAALLAPAIELHGEIAMRGEEPDSAPQRLATRPGALLRLSLHTDLDPAERAAGAPRLRLALRRGADLLWSTSVDPSTIPSDGILEMALWPEALPRGVLLELALEQEKDAGRPPLFVRRILLVEPAGALTPDGL